MATAYTSLLGLALPVTGELSGTWGDTVNNSITSLLDSAIAGTTTLSADTTLTTTTGASNQARQAILLCTGHVANITITAPAQSKIYTVINASATYTVKIRGVGPTTGITIPVSSTATVAWNGSDFVDASGYINGNLKVNGTLSVTGAVTLTAGTASTTTGTGTLVITGGLGVSGRINAANFDGIVGANTAAAGSFTTLAASSTLTVTGAGSIEGLTVGRGAGAAPTNTAVGADALSNGSQSGARNTSLGYRASYLNTSGENITALGAYAIYSNTTGTDHVGVGYGALDSNTTGSYNTALGTGALQANTTASNNTAVGYQAGYTNATGTNVVAFGQGALYTNDASDNTAVGRRAGFSNSSGTANAFFGTDSGYSTTSTGNSFFGSGSGNAVTSGAKNTIVGSYSGNTAALDIRTASNHIVLSDGDGNPAAYRLGINGQWWFGLGGTTAGSYEGAMILNGAATSGRGAALIGLSNGANAWSAGSYSYVVSGTSTFFAVANTSGGVYLNGASATAWTAVSDETRKVIIEPITDAANKVSTLRAVIGRLKSDDETVRRPYLIAQDVQAVLPEAVSESEDKEGAVLGLSYTEVIPLLVAAIKELKAEVDSLKAQINGASA